MKSTAFGLLTLFAVTLFLDINILHAQGEANPEDVSSIDAIMKSYYEVVSGPAGVERQWARDSSLHFSNPYIVLITDGENGEAVPSQMSLAEFHKSSRSLVDSGFFEYEIYRVVEERGALAQVWSTYEWRSTENGPIGGRGINSLQLFNDGKRYWLLSWMFDARKDAPPVPDKYLPEDLRSKENSK